MEVILDIISGDSKITKFMQACDMFESWKVVGKHYRLVVTGNPGMFNLATNMKNALENKEIGEIVSFVEIKSIDGIPAKNAIHYFRANTKAISDGKDWTTFKSALNQLGYEVETDKAMTVIKVESS